MKVTKSQLKELIRQAIVEDIMDKEIKNAKTGNMIKVRTALQLPGDHPANKMAKKLVAKSPTKKDKTGDDVGGPSYADVPKGAKTSKQAKLMKKNDSVAKKLNINTYGSPTLSDQSKIKCDSVQIGPGDSERSHTANEFVFLDEIKEAIPKYIKILETLKI